MSLEPVGLATFVIGLICLFKGYRSTVATLVVMGLFGSAAACFIGSANIQPGHFFLGFVALAALTRSRELKAFFWALHPNEPGFWFACLVFYGVVTAFTFPQILTGITQIIPLGTSPFEETGSTVPLVPVSSNISQSVYIVANLICFAMIVAIASTYDGFKAVFSGLLGFAIGNVLFAVVDLATFATGTQDVLSFIRNAQYTLHTDGEVNGMKRIVGSFTEASSFARATLGALGLTGTLWLCNYRPLLTGLLALFSLLLVLLSTSSTGLVGAPVLLLVLYLTALGRCGARASARISTIVVFLVPVIVAATCLILVLNTDLYEDTFDYVNAVILQKSASASGIERGEWNTVALQNISDSWGMGVGLGTVRASSFGLALLAGVGVPGTLLYLIFLGLAIFRTHGVPRSFTSDVRLSARNGCLGLLIGDLLSASAVDQGVFFCVLAAIAAAVPERSEFMNRNSELREAVA